MRGPALFRSNRLPGIHSYPLDQILLAAAGVPVPIGSTLLLACGLESPGPA